MWEAITQRGEWQEDRNTILAAAESDLHWEDWPGWVSGLYDTMYFAMNISTQDIVPHTLQITQRGDVWRQRLTPYFSYYDQLSIRQEEDGRYTYSFRLYTQEEMAIDWDEVSSDFVTNRDWYRALQGAYMQELDQYYLQVPREQLPRLAALCAAHPAADAQEATAFIRSMLQGNAVYTQTPGIFPLNEDPSEYFLFEGHAGYCQHFASTAVLMYRLLGHPGSLCHRLCGQSGCFCPPGRRRMAGGCQRCVRACLGRDLRRGPWLDPGRGDAVVRRSSACCRRGTHSASNWDGRMPQRKEMPRKSRLPGKAGQ